MADVARQRVLEAAARRRPDRIPIDYWADGEVTARLMRELHVSDKEALLQRLGVDLRYVGGPAAPARQREANGRSSAPEEPRGVEGVGEEGENGRSSAPEEPRGTGEPRGVEGVVGEGANGRSSAPEGVVGEGANGRSSAPSGLVEDHWGVLRRAMTVEGVDRTNRAWSWTYQHVHQAPLERATTLAEVERHAWPAADRWDYSGVKAECERARATGCAVVNGGDRLDRTAQLKPATYLRGMEQFLSDLLLEPAIAECILEHIAAYYLEYCERVFRAAGGAIDIFFMGDDMGTQTSLWVSPRLYRRFFKERFRRFNDLAHRYGMKTMYHTCGNVLALVPDFIECGLDILQSLQPGAMDLAALKREYGRVLAFQGGIDIQQTMPKGTPDDVRREVQERAAVLGRDGGYIFCTAHNLLPDVPTENIEALFAAYLEHGS